MSVTIIKFLNAVSQYVKVKVLTLFQCASEYLPTELNNTHSQWKTVCIGSRKNDFDSWNYNHGQQSLKNCILQPFKNNLLFLDLLNFLFINSHTMCLGDLDVSSMDLYTGDHIDTESVVHMIFF